MAVITFRGQAFECAPGQSVLDCLNRAGPQIPWSCGAGACQTCLMRAVKGTPDPGAQAGLSPTQQALGAFLACRWRPEADAEIEFGEPGTPPIPARVQDIALLSKDIVRLRLRPEVPFPYRAGQFLRLHRPGGASRCYSLASVPDLEDYLELHIKAVPQGEVSQWVHRELTAGGQVSLSPALGSSFYLPGRKSRGLCLIATGTGLAPLHGIARDALHQGHSGPIWLFHGTHHPGGLYLREAFEELQRRHPQLRYVPCVSGAPAPGAAHGRAHAIALERLTEAATDSRAPLHGWVVHLCGHSGMVEAARRALFLAGASMRDIHADPFLPSALHTGHRA